MYKIASTRATRRPDAPRARPRLCDKQAAARRLSHLVAVSDAVVVDVVRVGDDERLTISETLRLSLPRGVAVAFRSRASRAGRDTRRAPVEL